MADYEIPTLGDPAERTIPCLKPDAMAGSKPYVAAPAHNEALGFPPTLVPDWQEKGLARMGELLGKYKSLQVYMDICVKCGACTDKCHYFLGTHDPKNMPVARQDLFRSVYRRYFTPAGKALGAVGLGKLVGAREFTQEVLDEWFNYFHQCSQCRRCSVFCPYGIDTAEISMAARDIMDTIGQGHKYANEILGKVHKIGNNLGLPGPALIDTLEGLEEDLKDETGLDIRMPVDQHGAEVLLVTPSADFFAEPHVLGLMGYGKVFHAAGTSWTLSTKATEAANFAMFIGSYDQMRKVAMRIREAALELGVKRIIFGECGHAWRVAYSFLNTLIGPMDFLDPRYPKPQHILEFTWDLIKRGGIRLDKSGNAGMVLTFHDSCNVARASRMGDFAGGQFVIPREVIKACVPKFVEMHPDTTHEKTFCCGGGGGILTDELMDVRIKGAMPRMEALRDVANRDGVTHMASICAICKAQFTKVLPVYGFDRETVVSVHQLVSNAIVLGNND